MAKPVAPKRAPTMEEMLTAPPASIFEVRLGQATYIRQVANDLFGDEKYEEAMKLYERALFHCNFEKAEMNFELTQEYKNNIRETADPVHLNLALCCLKLKRYREVIKHAKNAIDKDSSDITKRKASYLIGKALVSLEEYEEALQYLSELDPSFPVEKCHLLLQKEAKEGIARNKKNEREIWRGKLKSQPEANTDSNLNNDTATTPTLSTNFNSKSNSKSTPQIQMLWKLLAIVFVVVGVVVASTAYAQKQ